MQLFGLPNRGKQCGSPSNHDQYNIRLSRQGGRMATVLVSYGYALRCPVLGTLLLPGTHSIQAFAR